MISETKSINKVKTYQYLLAMLQATFQHCSQFPLLKLAFTLLNPPNERELNHRRCHLSNEYT